MNIFVSSQVLRFGAARLGGVSLSLVTHAGLITLAVVGSGNTASFDTHLSNLVPAERVRYVEVSERGSAARAAAERALARAVKKARLIVPDLTMMRAAIDVSLVTVPVAPSNVGDIDVTLATQPSDFGEIDAAALLGMPRAYARPGRDGAYSAEVVERTAWPRRDNPSPRYPPSLLRSGIEASFPVQFVVDSTGRVDGKTLAFPASIHPMLMSAVKEALLHSRYFPAELAGARVRQLVQQQFTFLIAR